MMPATRSKPSNHRISWQVLFLRTLILTPGICAGGFAGAAEQTAGEAASAPALEEITVTATRREESINRVPISITAMNQAANKIAPDEAASAGNQPSRHYDHRTRGMTRSTAMRLRYRAM